MYGETMREIHVNKSNIRGAPAEPCLDPSPPIKRGLAPNPNAGSLDVYAAAKQHKDKVAGLRKHLRKPSVFFPLTQA